MIPTHARKGLIEWVHYGCQYEHGSFITAVIKNQLIESFEKADDCNRFGLFAICKWMHNNMPMSSRDIKYAGMSDEQFELWKDHLEKKGQ